MNDTDEMVEARYQLQELTAADPAASANMLRYVAALSLLVTGRRARDRRPGEPQFGAGFLLVDGNEQLFAATARRSGTDYVLTAFDVDDAAGPAHGIGVFHPQADGMVLFGNCRPWSPANDGRALLVPTGEGDYAGHLAFRPGRPFRLVQAPVPGDLEAGFRRAGARLARLLASEALREVHRDGYLHRIRNEGQQLFGEVSRAAA